MKKYILLILVGFLLLTSCNGETNTNNDNTDSNEPLSKSEENTSEDISLEEDDIDENQEENTDQTNVEDEETSPEVGSYEYLEMLVEESDYIIGLNMTKTGPQGEEYHIIEEYKGSFSNIKIPKIPGIKANTDYIVFMKDDPSGQIVPTDGRDSLVKYDEDSDIVVNIKDILGINDEDEEGSGDENSN